MKNKINILPIILAVFILSLGCVFVFSSSFKTKLNDVNSFEKAEFQDLNKRLDSLSEDMVALKYYINEENRKAAISALRIEHMNPKRFKEIVNDCYNDFPQLETENIDVFYKDESLHFKEVDLFLAFIDSISYLKFLPKKPIRGARSISYIDSIVFRPRNALLDAHSYRDFFTQGEAQGGILMKGEIYEPQPNSDSVLPLQFEVILFSNNAPSEGKAHFTENIIKVNNKYRFEKMVQFENYNAGVYLLNIYYNGVKLGDQTFEIK